ncbi:RNA 2'-phosphotransferase [Paenibacillus sp. NPDC056579]|uniref:RNA 2'-phosphotransferase n=1 Tax=Paenibacillus sp. NPDC056579 TaxID=3345871 RepID=UPI00369B55AC
MNSQWETSLSKLLTKMLRHTPEDFGLILDPMDGSCPLEKVVTAVKSAGPKWSWVQREHIEQVAAHSDKQRFEITGDRIRARYGHSHDKVRYPAATPPVRLYHGTNRMALSAILREGIRPMGRQYVHLSAGTHFASMAGSRRGELVLLAVDTVRAQHAGVTFYFAGNEVWLAGFIPPECCSVFETQEKGNDSNE